MLFVYSTIFVLGDVRLVGTGLKHVGKVELRYQGEWGTVCSNSYWDKVDAQVICRMLGYKAAVTYQLDTGLKERHQEECSCIMWDAAVTKSRLQTVLTMDGGMQGVIAPVIRISVSCWCGLPDRWR